MKVPFFVSLFFIPFAVFSQTLEADLQAWVDDNNIPGLAVGVIKENAMVYEGYFGMANFDTNTPVTDSTAFMLASMSKHVAQTAAVLAMESGYISSLSDPVNDYLSFDVVHPFDNTTLTIEMLINHTAGIRDNWDQMPYLNSDDDCTPLGIYMEQYLVPGGSIYFEDLNFTPTGTGSYEYSNIGYALLGYVIEEATGQDYGHFVRENLMERLCMNRSSFYMDELDMSLTAMPYNFGAGGFSPIGHYSYSDYPSGRLRTTLKDMSHYVLMHLGSGTMDTVSLLTPGGANLVGETGAGGDQGVSTVFRFDRDAGTGVIIFCNRNYNLNPATNIVENYIGQLNTLPADKLDCYTPPVPVSTSEISDELISIYPNPASEEVNISWGDLRVHGLKLYNNMGQLVLEKNIKNIKTYTIESNNLPPGTYFAEFISDFNINTKKLIIL